jgi:hypothetical protein
VELSPQHYLLVYGLVVILIVASFLIRRPGRPSRLNMSASDREAPTSPGWKSPVQAAAQSSSSKGAPQSRGAVPPSQGAAGRFGGEFESKQSHRSRAAHASDWEDADATDPGFAEKVLNVHFQWNGHSFDAYEALGLPARSSHEAVQAAYIKLVTQGDPQMMRFYKMAYETILRSR